MNSLDALKNLMYLDRFMLKIPKLALLFFLFPLSPLLALQKPNILWITAEDMSSSLGCYGDSDAITPNIDQFANESVRYTHAFASAPVCSPSRSCLIQGCLPPSMGTQHMRSGFPLPNNFKDFQPLKAKGILHYKQCKNRL